MAAFVVLGGVDLDPDGAFTSPSSVRAASPDPVMFSSGATKAIWLQLNSVFLPPKTNTSNRPANVPSTQTTLPWRASVATVMLAGTDTATGAWVDVDTFVQMRPGRPGSRSRASRSATDRSGYGHPSDTKTRWPSSSRLSESSGPASENGPVADRVSV
ncbi:hypothetical protein VTK73DRAFT_6466 [Phialemonium thermophilum]|uniref:Uncharacterized protein n=1 Tax=Phialemonium thermophilum TaxID=223376 RepID=A0ABR3UZP9_9PEZI